MTALEFPSDPEDGQIENGFIWDAATGIWKKDVSRSINDLHDVEISSPADGDFLIYDETNTEWINQAITYDINDLTSLDSDDIIIAPNYDIDVTTVSNPGTYNFDFSSGTGLFDISTNAAITFTGSNYKAGAIKTARIVNSTASNKTMTFPANWKFVGIKPTTLKASKTGILTITSFTTEDTGCVAAYVEEL
jgi:hypothetical protein